jgi:hypothetical protein
MKQIYLLKYYGKTLRECSSLEELEAVASRCYRDDGLNVEGISGEIRTEKAA